MKHLLPKTTLLDPIHYMEQEGYECRLAVHKAHDFLRTLGDANLSIIYANSKHYNQKEKEQLFVRRTYLRHALLDLNSCYDLLLQIPWFFYRVWEFYNFEGELRNHKLKNREDIHRNTEYWVQKAEESCSAEKLVNFFNSKKELLHIKRKFDIFFKTQIRSTQNTFTIRRLANQLKHNHNINFTELHTKPSFNFKINGVDSLNKNVKIFADFYDVERPENVLGNIEILYSDDFYLNIHYKDGDSYYAKDYLNKDRMYSMDEVYDSLVDFHKEILNLYELIINDIKPKLQLNNLVNEPRITSTSKMNMDKFFKPKA